MSKEKGCKCCKRIWYEDMLDKKWGLCPNCYEYCKPLIDGLKIEYKRIADVQHRLEVVDKALENVCKRLQDYYCTTCDNQANCSRVEMCEMSLSIYLPSDFKEQAEKELKGEKL